MGDHTKEDEARLKTEPCGELGIWIYIDGKIADLIHFSDLMGVVNDETRQKIDAIYEDCFKARMEREVNEV